MAAADAVGEARLPSLVGKGSSGSKPGGVKRQDVGADEKKGESFWSRGQPQTSKVMAGYVTVANIHALQSQYEVQPPPLCLNPWTYPVRPSLYHAACVRVLMGRIVLILEEMC